MCRHGRASLQDVGAAAEHAGGAGPDQRRGQHASPGEESAVDGAGGAAVRHVRLHRRPAAADRLQRRAVPQTAGAVHERPAVAHRARAVVNTCG